ncbi:MAG: signal recognition particle receptor subunit alpha, partial [Idiomarina sp.]|nr:signal recognition particle receptor subunit alpha [Idiomarina sp.]
MAKKRSIFSSWFGVGRKEEDEQQDQATPSQEQTESPKDETVPTPEPAKPRPADATEDAAIAMAESAAKRHPATQPQQPTPEQPQPTEPQAKTVTAEPEPAGVSPVASTPIEQAPPIAAAAATSVDSKTAERPGKQGLWARLREGLKKTSSNIGEGLANIFVGKEIDEELFEDLETQLLMADVGVETTQKIIDELTKFASRKDLKDADRLFDRLKEYLGEIVAPVSKPLVIEKHGGPTVILMVGVNGVGKTT